MIKNKYIDESINILDFNIDIIKILNTAGIFLIKDLWSTNRSELKKINLTDHQINQIVIKLQLIGLDLNKKVYN